MNLSVCKLIVSRCVEFQSFETFSVKNINWYFFAILISRLGCQRELALIVRQHDDCSHRVDDDNIGNWSHTTDNSNLTLLSGPSCISIYPRGRMEIALRVWRSLCFIIIMSYN